MIPRDVRVLQGAFRPFPRQFRKSTFRGFRRIHTYTQGGRKKDIINQRAKKLYKTHNLKALVGGAIVIVSRLVLDESPRNRENNLELREFKAKKKNLNDITANQLIEIHQ